jgi:hypothetical protein
MCKLLIIEGKDICIAKKHSSINSNHLDIKSQKLIPHPATARLSGSYKACHDVSE